MWLRCGSVGDAVARQDWRVHDDGHETGWQGLDPFRPSDAETKFAWSWAVVAEDYYIFRVHTRSMTFYLVWILELNAPSHPTWIVLREKPMIHQQGRRMWNPESNEGGHGEAVEAHVASKLTPVSTATTLVVAPFSIEAPIWLFVAPTPSLPPTFLPLSSLSL